MLSYFPPGELVCLLFLFCFVSYNWSRFDFMSVCYFFRVLKLLELLQREDWWLLTFISSERQESSDKGERKISACSDHKKVGHKKVRLPRVSEIKIICVNLGLGRTYGRCLYSSLGAWESNKKSCPGMGQWTISSLRKIDHQGKPRNHANEQLL